MIGSRIVKIIRFSALPNWARTGFRMMKEGTLILAELSHSEGKLIIRGGVAYFNGKTVKGDDEPLLAFEEE
ncbi:hypothetical protein A3H19_00465 [Candidatus Woesebacteria bacterium RIFCSPLOWO2_12_FULL_39_9]|nr:MAG: hypothetical protein A3H19_00465 [Candidatus Woesebacteria bacterium RIFCSPLOWO2_12_FULL_39_9]